MKYDAPENNTNEQLTSQGNALFSRICLGQASVGRVLENLFARRNGLLDLSTLVALVPAIGETSQGSQDIPVERIIGSENRSADYAEGFVPRHLWMASRWVKVYELLHGPGIPEPVQLIEYGGYYFVRDGNHRVSVAKNSGIEYLRAQVTSWKAPVGLPPDLCVNELENFVEKAAFQARTGFFDLVDESLVLVKNPRTWKLLEKEVYVYSANWYVRNQRCEVGHKELIESWLPFYTMAIEHIRQHSMAVLFPGMYETDVFVELTEYWNSHEDPDSIWFGEIYEKFERYFQKRRVLQWFRRTVSLTWWQLNASPNDARNEFLLSSQILTFVPGFVVPMASKEFFTLCYRQIFRIYGRWERDHSATTPQVDTLETSWYHKFYKPVIDTYRERLYPMPFDQFYIRFSRYAFLKVIRENIPVHKLLATFEKRFH